MNETAVVTRAPGGTPQRRKRRGKPARGQGWSRQIGGKGRGDAIVIALLALLLGAAFARLAATPPTRLAFDVASAPGNAIFRNFYGVERNARGPFRWTKPEASMTIPVAAPATYAITLTLQDSPSAPPGRQTTVYLNGQAIGRATLTGAPQAARFVYDYTPAIWSGGANGLLTLELATPGYVPPGDPRSLGALVADIAIEQVSGNSAPVAALAGLALLVMLVVYALLRLCGPPLLAGGACGVGVLGLGVFALARPSAALRALVQQVYHPRIETFLACGMVLALLLCCVAIWRLPLAALGAPAAPPVPVALAWPWFAWVGVGALTLLGFFARFARYDALSLWLDETATLYFARTPWDYVLGLHGVYDPHPPLYYALVKLATNVLPELGAGRLVSVIAGAATIPVLCLIVGRLANWRAALAAGLLLAVSPLHLWYSQEARMYASALLLLALSYLALIAFCQEWRVRWAVLYGVATLLSLYLSYSSLYALIPQILIFGLVTRRAGRASLPLWFATLGVGVGLLPWVVQAGGTVGAIGQDRAWFLGVTPGKLVTVSLSAIGVKNGGAYFWDPIRAPWENSAPLLFALVIALALTAAFGVMLLTRASPLGLFVSVGLFVGTIGTSAGISLVSPGFAERTIMAAVLGWSLAVGVAAFGRAQPRWPDWLARGGLIVALVVSGLTIDAYTRGATKTDYRGLAADMAQASRFGLPVVGENWLGATANAYQPSLNPTDRAVVGQVDAFWYAYPNDQGGIWQDFERLGTASGYERVSHLIVTGILSFDLYLKPGARLPEMQAVPVASPGAAPWQLPTGARLAGAGDATTLALTGTAPATFAVPYTPDSLYLLEVESDGADSGNAALALQCLDGANAPLLKPGGPPASHGAAGWETARAATFCPAGTATLRVSLANRGAGTVSYKNVRLWRVPQVTVTGNR